MNNRIIIIVLLLGFACQTNAQLTNLWTATITDATISLCSDGAIDLHPPLPNGQYRYTWFKTGSAFPIGYTEDINNLSPGQYKVEVDGPLCDDLFLTYFVGLKEYNFDLYSKNPSDCEEGPAKSILGSGIIRLTWNDDVLPEPLVTLLYPSGNTTSVSNGQFIGELGPGRYTLTFSVGDCEWITYVDLCCCGVSDDLPIFQGAEGICESLTDGIPFEIETRQIIAATDWDSRDGSIRVLIHSPSQNSRIKWTGPRRGNQQEIYYGTYLQNLLPGEYCYEYSDDCVGIITGCVTVDHCILNCPGVPQGTCTSISQSFIRENEGTCLNKSDAIIRFDVLNWHSRDFKIHVINPDGSTGEELENVDYNNPITISELRPGNHTYRFVSEQLCESELTFTIPLKIESGGEWSTETCSRELFCDGEYVTTVYYDYEILPSEYCFITRKLCPLTGSTPIEEPNFNESNVQHPVNYDIDDKTCSYLYYCEEDNQWIDVHGEISFEILSQNCNGINRESPPIVRIGLFCNSTVSETEISTEISDVFEPVTGVKIREDRLNCPLYPILFPDELNGNTITYSITFPNGETETITCCKSNGATPLPLQGISEGSNLERLDCNGDFEYKSCQLVNLGTGASSFLSRNQTIVILNQMEEYGSVKSSHLNFQFPPGVFALTSSNCKTIHVTIL